MSKILLIEDDRDIRRAVETFLRHEGFEVVMAEDGQSGIDTAAMLLPDMIICDVLMPGGIDGYAVADQIRANKATAAVPFVFLSGMSSKSDIRKGMNAGADDYITKPFTRGELIAAVKARLERHSRNRLLADGRVEELRGSIASSMPHEFLTPLTNILGYSDMMIRSFDSFSKGEIVDMAAEIKKSGERLHRLVENFLLYADLELALANSEVRASFTAGHTIGVRSFLESISRERASACGRASDLDCEFEECAIVISQDNLKKVIDEVLNNAFGFSDAGTKVRISGRAAEGRFVICVSNAGRGMSPEQIAGLGAYVQYGRRFYEQKGLGLGLSIVRRICELHDGSVEIASVPGEGVTVTITLAAVS